MWKTTKEDALMDQDNLCFTKKKKQTQKTKQKKTHTHPPNTSKRNSRAILQQVRSANVPLQKLANST